MKIIVNGNENSTSAQSVAEWLDANAVDYKLVAVELNGTLLDKNAYDTKLNDGDSMEVVRFVGGG